MISLKEIIGRREIVTLIFLSSTKVVCPSIDRLLAPSFLSRDSSVQAEQLRFGSWSQKTSYFCPGDHQRVILPATARPGHDFDDVDGGCDVRGRVERQRRFRRRRRRGGFSHGGKDGRVAQGESCPTGIKSPHSVNQ